MTAFPQNWFWSVSGKSGFYSSAARSYVPELPENWFASVPELIAADASPMIAQTADPAASEGELFDLLRAVCPEGLPFDATAYAAQKRWERETQGIDVNGVLVATDDRSKLMISGARIKAESDPNFETPWVGTDGAVHMLGAAQIIAISDAVLGHVASCFSIYSTVVSADPPMAKAQIDDAFSATVPPQV